VLVVRPRLDKYENLHISQIYPKTQVVLAYGPYENVKSNANTLLEKNWTTIEKLIKDDIIYNIVWTCSDGEQIVAKTKFEQNNKVYKVADITYLVYFKLN